MSTCVLHNFRMLHEDEYTIEIEDTNIDFNDTMILKQISSQSKHTRLIFWLETGSTCFVVTESTKSVYTIKLTLQSYIPNIKIIVLPCYCGK